jgi:predicted PurR-regulated permease PerM
MGRDEGIKSAVQEADEEAAVEPVSTRSVFRRAVAAGLGLLAVYLGYRAVILMADVVVQVLIAAFLAISLDPVVRWMVRRKVKRGQAVAIIFAGLLAFLALFLWVFLPPLIHQGANLTTDFPGYLDHLRSRSQSLRSLEDRFHLQNAIHDFAANAPAKLGQQALGFGQRFLGALISAVLVVVLTIYFMVDLPRLRRGLVRLFPKRQRRAVNEAVNVVIDKVGSYMIGNLIVSVFAGTATLIALLALRVPFALPLAVFVAVADLLPLIGATLGASVCVIVGLATGEVWPTVVLIIVFFVVYQQVENYLIVPRVMRGSVRMSSLAVLLAALIGASALGLVGALMAIPVVAAIGVLITPVIQARDEEPTGDPTGDPTEDPTEDSTQDSTGESTEEPADPDAAMIQPDA